MSIVVENISKRYGEQLALNSVTFSIPSNQVVGFLGPNGAGKSTMMKILTGYLPANGGTACINNIDVLKDPLSVKQEIGYLPENNPLYNDFYVKEYLEFVGNMYGVRSLRKRVSDVIEIAGVGYEQNKKIGSLSKGYKQRVGLAQSLIHDPKVLILDEPTTGLDPNQIVEIRSLIEQIGREKTVMLSTHIMQEVEAICQNIIIIDKGVIVANGSTKEIVSLASDSKEVKVEFEKLPTADQVDGLKSIGAILNHQHNTFVVKSADSVDIRPKLFKFAVDNSLVIVQMQQQEAHLENVFRSLTTSK